MVTGRHTIAKLACVRILEPSEEAEATFKDVWILAVDKASFMQDKEL